MLTVLTMAKEREQTSNRLHDYMITRRCDSKGFDNNGSDTGNKAVITERCVNT